MSVQPVFRALLAALALLLFAGGEHALAAGDDSYVLDSGDRVKVTVFGEEDLTGEYEIDGTGTLAFPLVGQIAVAGSSARDLEVAIADRLRGDYLLDPKVNVEILTYRPFYILGEVQRPGSYSFKSGMTVLNAVAMAGGYTYRAKTEEWIVTRADDPALQEAEIEAPSFRVRPGDVIVVPERFW